ncbi:hypothetical protein OG21DRAFT_395140 [Imleria badia]|nr:hypothetical protein OG21DRAFT_395140 [Imleria badia]
MHAYTPRRVSSCLLLASDLADQSASMRSKTHRRSALPAKVAKEWCNFGTFTNVSPLTISVSAREYALSCPGYNACTPILNISTFPVFVQLSACQQLTRAGGNTIEYWGKWPYHISPVVFWRQTS